MGNRNAQIYVGEPNGSNNHRLTTGYELAHCVSATTNMCYLMQKNKMLIYGYIKSYLINIVEIWWNLGLLYLIDEVLHNKYITDGPLWSNVIISTWMYIKTNTCWHKIHHCTNVYKVWKLESGVNENCKSHIKDHPPAL